MAAWSIKKTQILHYLFVSTWPLHRPTSLILTITVIISMIISLALPDSLTWSHSVTQIQHELLTCFCISLTSTVNHSCLYLSLHSIHDNHILVCSEVENLHFGLITLVAKCSSYSPSPNLPLFSFKQSGAVLQILTDSMHWHENPK